MFNIPRIVISGPHRSAGKTTVSAGLCKAYKERGITPQPYKKGPDYIDPMWLTAASERDCRNLDFHMMGDENILRSFRSAIDGARIAIIEGNAGLFDGMDIEGTDSTAGLAHLLEAPVIMVVDASRMNRGIAPLLFGYERFDEELNIAGVILNKVGNPRHETKLVKAIERYVGMEILGAIPKASDEMIVAERHLGLTPIKEDPALLEKLELIGRQVGENVNLYRIMEIASQASELPEVSPCIVERKPATVKIGVAMDRAFTFYYPENLEALGAAGAELVPFSPLEHELLPEVNALYIGGGFPEMFMEELMANETLRNQIKHEVEEGTPVYAECGGLMYLARSITWNGDSKMMTGALPCDVVMTKKPQGLGYVTLEATGRSDWLAPSGAVKCHEFHHSFITNIEEPVSFAWNVTRGVGMAGKKDGIIYKNTIASYAHLHHCGAPDWATGFVELAKRVGRSTLPTTVSGVQSANGM